MSKKTCAEFEDLLIVHGDGELGGEELARLETHLDDCARCRTTLAEYQAMDVAAKAAFGVRRDEVPASAPFARPALRVVEGGAVPARPGARRWFLPLALAAAIVLSVGAPWLIRTGIGKAPEEGAFVGRVSAPAFALGTRDRMMPGAATATFPAGTWIEFFAAPGVLELGDRVCTVEPGTLLRADVDSDRIERGAVEIAHAGRPGYAVETPHGRVEALGTRLRVEVAGGSTAVRLLMGRVRLTGKSGLVDLIPGQAAVMGEDLGPAIVDFEPTRRPADAVAVGAPESPPPAAAASAEVTLPKPPVPVAPSAPATPVAVPLPVPDSVVPAAPAPTGEATLGTTPVDLDSMDEKTRNLLFPGRR